MRLSTIWALTLSTSLFGCGGGDPAAPDGGDADTKRDAGHMRDALRPLDAPRDRTHADSEAKEAALLPEPEAGGPEAESGTDASDAGLDAAPTWWTNDASPPTDGAVSTTYPAFLPVNPPQATTPGGSILTSPRFIPVVFAHDPYEAQINAFVAAVGPSQYWHEATSEYGVGAASSVPAIEVAESAPLSIDAAAIEGWLAQKLATDPRFGAVGIAGDGGVLEGGVVDASADARSVNAPPPDALYIVYYPETTMIYGGGLLGQSCQLPGFFGYHEAMTLPGGAVVIYAVIARCAEDVGPTGFDLVSAITSHEMAEAATDPEPGGGYSLGGQEIGDVCEYGINADLHVSEPSLSPFLVQRIWSNASAAGGHDGCVPNLPGEVYCNAEVIGPDTLEVPPGQGSGVVPGGRIPLSGGKATFAVAVACDGPVVTPWPLEVDGLMGIPMVVSFPQSSGTNGSLLPLTISAPMAQVGPGIGFFPFTVASPADSTQSVNPSSAAVEVYRGP